MNVSPMGTLISCQWGCYVILGPGPRVPRTW